MPTPTTPSNNKKSFLDEQAINEYYDVGSRSKKVTKKGMKYRTSFTSKQSSSEIEKIIISGDKETIDISVIFIEKITDEFYKAVQDINLKRSTPYEVKVPESNQITILGIILNSDEYMQICDLLFPKWYRKIHNNAGQPKNGTFFYKEHMETIEQKDSEPDPIGCFSLTAIFPCLFSYKSVNRMAAESVVSAPIPETPASQHSSKIVVKLE